MRGFARLAPRLEIFLSVLRERRLRAPLVVYNPIERELLDAQGYEREVTAEAGYRVGLSAGAKVVHVASGPLGADDVRSLRASSPDIVLLCGGTDGGWAGVQCRYFKLAMVVSSCAVFGVARMSWHMAQAFL